MKLTKEQKSNEEVVPAVDVELNEEQLETVSGGSTDPFKPITTSYVPTPTPTFPVKHNY